MGSLFIESEGNGRPVALIHGWGLHGGVWSGVAKALASAHRVIRVDLPGFGASPSLAGAYTADALAEAVAAAVPDEAVWVGWSLGGTVALAAASRGVSMKQLVLVGSTPRFVQDAGWPHAMAPEVLAAFAAELQEDYRATVLRFLALQARGSERAREELRELRDTVFARGEPALNALQGGLDILREADLREALSRIKVPTLLIHGERDVLVPLAAAVAAREALPDARLESIPGAGHAPFLSHPELFAHMLNAFLHE